MRADPHALATTFMSGCTTSCQSAAARVPRRSSATPSSSRSPSPRGSSTAKTTAGSSPWPVGGWGSCFPACPSSPATTSACARPLRRSSPRSTRFAFNSDAFATGCWCSTRPRCPVASRGRRLAARRSPATPPTATAARTRAFSGAFCSSCSVRPTDAERLRPRGGQPPRAPGGRRDPRARLGRGAHRAGRQRLRRARVRAAGHRPRRAARPDRKNETPRFGSLGRMRQWVGVIRGMGFVSLASAR